MVDLSVDKWTQYLSLFALEKQINDYSLRVLKTSLRSYDR